MHNRTDKQHKIIIVIVIIVSKGTIQDFYNLLTALRIVSNTYAQVVQVQLCANHLRQIEHLSCATCCVPRGTEAQLLSLTEFKSHLFFALFYWLNL